MISGSTSAWYSPTRTRRLQHHAAGVPAEWQNRLPRHHGGRRSRRHAAGTSRQVRQHRTQCAAVQPALGHDPAKLATGFRNRSCPDKKSEPRHDRGAFVCTRGHSVRPGASENIPPYAVDGLLATASDDLTIKNIAQRMRMSVDRFNDASSAECRRKFKQPRY